MRRKSVNVENLRDVVLVDPPTRNYDVEEFVVDGLLRRAGVLLADNGDIDDVVIWCPGAAHYGPELLQHVVPVSGRADIGPTALAVNTHTGPSWVIPGLSPGDPFYPHEAPNDETDLHFLEAIIAWARARWPGCRIWFEGNSKGAFLGWAALAFNRDFLTSEISGYWLSICGTPTFAFYGWDFNSRAGLYDLRPVASWHGSDDSDLVSQTFAGASSWTQTAVDLLAICGHSAWSAYIDLPNCCAFPLKFRVGTAGPVRVRESWLVEGPHAFIDCPMSVAHPCREAIYAIAWHTQNGLGS